MTSPNNNGRVVTSVLNTRLTFNRFRNLYYNSSREVGVLSGSQGAEVLKAPASPNEFSSSLPPLPQFSPSGVFPHPPLPTGPSHFVLLHP
ncbi:hypothetical protein TNCV_4490441 [Trichonephila clavipes]|nr:hypothetical protein TNCV_4490441 [Trichonephila clavipes]